MTNLQALNPKDARVLVVEDSPSDQEIAGRALHNFGIRHWRVARTAEAALEELRHHAYDVAFVDYHLPGMNGIQFVERLQQLAPDVRVVVVTGARQESVAVAAMRLGVTDYISKDEFLTAGIVRTLQAALRQSRQATETAQRATLATASRDLQAGSVEGAWLLQALDERHGYAPGARSARDPIEADWHDIVALFVAYLRVSFSAFPAPATSEEDALLRALVERGLSPRDAFRVYVAALRELIDAGEGRDGPPARPVLFLTHVLACLVEELQVMMSISQASGRPF